MNKIKNLEIGKNILYSDGYFSNEYNQELYLRRTIDDASKRPRFYINIFSNINGILEQQGFLYFYLDYETKSSYFIGIYIEPKYRNLNIGSFLIASWIDLCLNNGYDFLGTNQRQRKPFLIYLLKTFGFEILDKSLYDTRDDVISICKSIDYLDKRKLLLFKNSKHENNFIKTNIYKHDNYEIIHNTDNIVVLDNIILPLQNFKKNRVTYELMNEELARAKVKKIISKHSR